MNENHDDERPQPSDRIRWDSQTTDNDFEDLDNHTLLMDLKSQIRIEITDLEALSTNFNTTTKSIANNLSTSFNTNPIRWADKDSFDDDHDASVDTNLTISWVNNKLGIRWADEDFSITSISTKNNNFDITTSPHTYCNNICVIEEKKKEEKKHNTITENKFPIPSRTKDKSSVLNDAIVNPISNLVFVHPSSTNTFSHFFDKENNIWTIEDEEDILENKGNYNTTNTMENPLDSTQYHTTKTSTHTLSLPCINTLSSRLWDCGKYTTIPSYNKHTHPSSYMNDYFKKEYDTINRNRNDFEYQDDNEYKYKEDGDDEGENGNDYRNKNHGLVDDNENYDDRVIDDNEDEYYENDEGDGYENYNNDGRIDRTDYYNDHYDINDDDDDNYHDGHTYYSTTTDRVTDDEDEYYDDDADDRNCYYDDNDEDEYYDDDANDRNYYYEDNDGDNSYDDE